MTELEIAKRIKGKKKFDVGSAEERRKALVCSKFLGIPIRTELKQDKSGFTIFFSLEGK